MDNLKGEQSPFYRREVKTLLTKFNLYQPAAIDNSLNSYQIIHKIIHEMNLIIDEINNIDSKANEYTDEQIRLLKAELQIKFDNIENEIVLLGGRIDLTNSNLTTLENAFNNFRTAITASVNQLSINVANLSDYVAQTESMLINYIDNKIDVLTHLIETLKGVKVFGYDGKLTTVQQALDELKNVVNRDFNNITINFAKYIFNNAYGYISSPFQQLDLSNCTIGNLKNSSNFNNSYWIIGGSTKFMYIELKNNFKQLIEHPYYSIFQIYYLAFATYISPIAQSQTPVVLDTYWQYFSSSLGFGSLKSNNINFYHSVQIDN